MVLEQEPKAPEQASKKVNFFCKSRVKKCNNFWENLNFHQEDAAVRILQLLTRWICNFFSQIPIFSPLWGILGLEKCFYRNHPRGSDCNLSRLHSASRGSGCWEKNFFKSFFFWVGKIASSASGRLQKLFGSLCKIEKLYLCFLCISLGWCPLVQAEVQKSAQSSSVEILPSSSHVLPRVSVFGKGLTVSLRSCQWHSSSHVTLFFVLTPALGCKVYAPEAAGHRLPNGLKLSLEEGSENILDIQPLWPEAQMWQDYGQKSYVYTEEIPLPVNVFLKKRSHATLKMTMRGMMCAQVCQPFSQNVSLSLEAPKQSSAQWWWIVWAAFLGGLILNGMPCVLPVLGLKIRTLSSGGGHSIRRVCAITLLGILSGFWIFAALISGLKMFGQEVGWGFQMNNPYFLWIMAGIMVASAYSSWGVFHMATPRWAYEASRLSQQQQSAAVKHFLSGLLSVALATPCSGPFLGGALGFALTGSVLEIFFFFTAIGLGLGMPYILGLFFTKIPSLPKPGAWVMATEKIMGLLLFASAVWLMGWPLSAFLSPESHRGVLGILGFLFIVPFFQFFSVLKNKKLWRLLVFYALPLGLFSIVGGMISVSKDSSGQGVSMRDGAVTWTPFQEDLLWKSLASGRVVFVDMTGAGCPQCVMNKGVFLAPEIQRLLCHPAVLCMRGDCSHDDGRLMGFLHKFGRGAIPFDMILSKEYPKGIVLSEFLTKKQIIDGFRVLRSFRQNSSLPFPTLPGDEQKRP